VICQFIPIVAGLAIVDYRFIRSDDATLTLPCSGGGVAEVAGEFYHQESSVDRDGNSTESAGGAGRIGNNLLGHGS
jgi:hypothetical protein